jgi:hypothetical protein
MFDIIKEGNIFYVSHNIYPRLTLTIDCSRTLAQIKDIQVLDDCSASELMIILSSIEDLIKDLEPCH